jgi:amphi-Trp domain-containing protein
VSSKNKDKEKDRDGVDYEATVPMAVVLAYLEELKKHLGEGELRVENGSKEVLLTPPGEGVELKFRARAKGEEQSLRFDLTWRSTEPAPRPRTLVLNGAAPNGVNGSHGESTPRPPRTRK